MIGGWTVVSGRMGFSRITGAVPGGAFYNGGAAFTSAGLRYSIANAAPTGAVSIGGVAHSVDGAVYTASTGTPAGLPLGVPVNSAGAILVDDASAIPFFAAAYPLTAAGFLASNGAVPIVTWNPLDKSTRVTLSNGDKTATGDATATSGALVRATTSNFAGKYYFEVLLNQQNTTPLEPTVGIANASEIFTNQCGASVNSWAYLANGQFFHLATSGAPPTLATGNIVQVAWDATAGLLWFGKNNVFNGSPSAGTGQAFSGVTGSLFPAVSVGGNATTPGQATGRFVTSDFTYSPPSGFSAWG